MKELTKCQWAKEGFVPKHGAIGVEKWINCYHTKKAIYFSEDQVTEDKSAAETFLKDKQKEYRAASKRKEQKYKRAMEYREKMKTEYQWLQEGRIPNEHARWELGESLNKTFNICAYGSQYFYCHEDDTHVPESLEELENAIRLTKEKYQQ